jgi:hypothetical protein
MKIVLIAICIVVGGLVFYLASPWILARRVTFVIPDNFRGLIRVYSTSSGRPFRGTINVPTSGEIPASDVSGEQEFQKITAHWSSGAQLEIKPIGDQTPDKTFLWILSYPGKSEYYFFVGTLAELKPFWSANYNRLYGVR